MRKAILILILLIAPNLFSQDNEGQEVRIVNHQVMMGETVKMLSRKYLVPPSEIYRLNKFAVDGIKQGMVLKIPVPIKDEPAKEGSVAQETPHATEPVPDANPQQSTLQESVVDVEKAMDAVPASSETASSASMVSHRVVSGETLSGLAQQYGTTVKAIKEANPKVEKRGLRADETIKIPSSGGVVPSNEAATYESPKQAGTSGTENAVPSAESVTHTVQPGETLFGLARKYNVPVDVIKQQNPGVAKKGLQTGQVLKIKGN